MTLKHRSLNGLLVRFFFFFFVNVGGWGSAPDGPYSWGYCYLREQNPGSYCASDPNYPCAPGRQYYGRGPIQLSWLVFKTSTNYYCSFQFSIV